MTEADTVLYVLAIVASHTLAMIIAGIILFVSPKEKNT